MNSDPAFTTDEVSTGYGSHVVSRRLSLTIEHGTRTALVGPNGSGKSTTLKTLARLIAPLRGAVYLSGQDINRLPTRQVARQMAILPQVHEVPAELTVMELVEQGRFPHVGALGMLRRRDDEAIQDAIRMTRLSEFIHRPYRHPVGRGTPARLDGAGSLPADRHPATWTSPPPFSTSGTNWTCWNWCQA